MHKIDLVFETFMLLKNHIRDPPNQLLYHSIAIYAKIFETNLYFSKVGVFN